MDGGMGGAFLSVADMGATANSILVVDPGRRNVLSVALWDREARKEWCEALQGSSRESGSVDSGKSPGQAMLGGAMRTRRTLTSTRWYRAVHGGKSLGEHAGALSGHHGSDAVLQAGRQRSESLQDNCYYASPKSLDPRVVRQREATRCRLMNAVFDRRYQRTISNRKERTRQRESLVIRVWMTRKCLYRRTASATKAQ